MARTHGERYMVLMPAWLAAVLITLATVLVMEGVAWSAHKYVMHGFGWAWHKSHHEPRHGTFERNDLYAAVGSVTAISLFVAGLWIEPLTWVALGVTLYGAIYFFVHDMLVHQRFGFRWVPKRGYAKRLLQAHRLHHAVKGKDGAVSFGFLFAGDPAKLKQRIEGRAGR